MADRSMTKEQQQFWIDNAVELTTKRLNSNYNNAPLYKYILNQLEYIGNSIKNDDFSNEQLSDINLGHLAVREFEATDKEYSNALKKAYFIVYYRKQGKKVPLLNE